MGEAGRRGFEYEVANGVRIPNLGEKTFIGYTDDGVMKRLTSQVCDVNKALLSVKKITANGHRVVFDSEGSFIEDKMSGNKVWMREEGGMWMLKMWVNTKEAAGF